MTDPSCWTKGASSRLKLQAPLLALQGEAWGKRSPRREADQDCPIRGPRPEAWGRGVSSLWRARAACFPNASLLPKRPVEPASQASGPES